MVAEKTVVRWRTLFLENAEVIAIFQNERGSLLIRWQFRKTKWWCRRIIYLDNFCIYIIPIWPFIYSSISLEKYWHSPLTGFWCVIYMSIITRKIQIVQAKDHSINIKGWSFQQYIKLSTVFCFDFWWRFLFTKIGEKFFQNTFLLLGSLKTYRRQLKKV